MSDAIMPAWLHPAECGFLLAFNNPMEFPSVITVHVDPARPEAWRNPWAMTVFSVLAERFNCVVAIGQVPVTTHLFTPDGGWWDVAASPVLMNEATGTVGAPSYVF